MYSINSAALTDVGLKRQNNEDYVAFFEPQDLNDRMQSGCLYIVADGVGGAAKGERASQFAAQSVLYDYYRSPSVPIDERLSQAMRQANAQIYNFAEQSLEGRMATTMVVAVIRQNILSFANVGDSRAYLLRNDTATQLTRDHSMVGEMVREGVMTEAEAQRSNMKNRLLRSLGGEPDVQVELYPEIPLMPGDKIVLCSDGLTSYALGEDILRMSRDGSPQEIASRLVQFARQAGGADNISAIVIAIGQEESGATKTWRGQKPMPVNWDDMPTDKHKPVKSTAASARPAARKLPAWAFWLIGIGLLGVIAVVVVVGLIAGAFSFGKAGKSISTQSTSPAAVSTGDICLYQVKKGETLGIVQVRFGSAPDPTLYKSWVCDPGPASCKDSQPITSADQVAEGMWLQIPGPVDCPVGGGVIYSQ